MYQNINDEHELITLLNNLKNAPPEQRTDSLKAIAMFLHRESCESHTPYLIKTGLNYSDLQELEDVYRITIEQQILFKVRNT